MKQDKIKKYMSLWDYFIIWYKQAKPLFVHPDSNIDRKALAYGAFCAGVKYAKKKAKEKINETR